MKEKNDIVLLGKNNGYWVELFRKSLTDFSNNILSATDINNLLK